MRNFRIIAVKRGALPSAPISSLAPGQTRGSTIGEEFAATEEETYATCLARIKEGYRLTVTTPTGEEWTNDHIVSALRARGDQA